MSINAGRVAGVIRKELTEFRRNKFILYTMTVFPLFILVPPTITLLATKLTVDDPRVDKQVGLELMFLLFVPVLVPATIAAYSVVGERDQGTLEPVLTTPVRREELLIGKAISAFIPAVVLAYAVFGIFLGLVHFFAHPVIAAAISHAPQLKAEAVYIPLLAGWAVWVGLAISTVARDTRVAQQLGTLAAIPPVVVVALFNFNVITPTATVAVTLGAALLVIDCFAYLVVSRLFDRERLVTGSRTGPGSPTSGARSA
jgi:ABC-2 type transport system permease protein